LIKDIFNARKALEPYLIVSAAKLLVQTILSFLTFTLLNSDFIFSKTACDFVPIIIRLGLIKS